MNRYALQAGIVAWPAFLAAGVIEIFVFAFVEPAALHDLGGGTLDLSSTAIYSIAFLGFWALVGAASVVSLTLARGVGETETDHGDSAPR
jgi:hypothetical protein